MADVIIPPLTQSGESLAGCPLCYVTVVLNGEGGGESTASERGVDVHHVMARYTAHCALNEIPSDWNYFNLLAAQSGPVAGPILDGVRDRYVVDFKHVWRAEFALGLDANFEPACRVVGNDRYPAELERIPGLFYSNEPCAYVGTLDVIRISDDGEEAWIDDHKTFPGIFEVDTEPQGERYAFMLLKHFPDVQKVTFKYDFLRYTNAYRMASWRREDMPTMQASMARALERQRLTVLNPDQAKAIPCKSCLWCPKAKDFSCPIAETNEWTTLTMGDRLRWKVWMAQMNKLNNPILKSFAEVKGPVSYRDGNNRVYEFGEEPVPVTRITLDRTMLGALKDHRESTGEDLLDGRLNVSSTKLKQLLKTRKREVLREVFEDSIYETSTKPAYRVRTPEGIMEEENPYRDE